MSKKCSNEVARFIAVVLLLCSQHHAMHDISLLACNDVFVKKKLKL